MVRGTNLKLLYLLLGLLLFLGGCSPKEAITKLLTGSEDLSIVLGSYDPGSGLDVWPSPSPTASDKPASTPAATAAPSEPNTLAPTPSTSPEQAPTPSPKPANNKLVALTFDDGPDGKYTPAIMDILKEKGVHATFFSVGIQVVQYPKILNRMIDEDHIIGNHSWDHKKLTLLSGEAIKQEIDKTNQAIKAAVGSTTPWFRAPYGTRSGSVDSIIAKTGSTHIGWTVDTRDWAGTAPTEMMAITKRQLKPGGIILMHSFGGKGGKLDNTLEFLPQLIDYLQEEGYSIVTVPELMAAKNI